MDEQQLRQRLGAEARQATITPAPEAWDAIRSKVRRRGPRRMAVLAAAAAVIVAAAVAIPLALIDRETVTGLTSSPTPAPTITPGPEQTLDCFFEARIRRDLEAARPCMSQRLYESYDDPVEFIGPSSPNIQRFEMLEEVERSDELVIVRVRAYSGTPTSVLFTSEDTLTVFRSDGRWVVDSWEQGEEVPTEQGEGATPARQGDEAPAGAG